MLIVRLRVLEVNERLRAFGPPLRGRGGRGGRGGYPGRGGLGPSLAGRLDFGPRGPVPGDFRGPSGPEPLRDGPSRPFRDAPDRPLREGPDRPLRDGPRSSFTNGLRRDSRPEQLDRGRSSSMQIELSADNQVALPACCCHKAWWILRGHVTVASAAFFVAPKFEPI